MKKIIVLVFAVLVGVGLFGGINNAKAQYANVYDDGLHINDFVAPAGGETWQVGSNVNITWKQQVVAGEAGFQIYYGPDGVYQPVSIPMASADYVGSVPVGTYTYRFVISPGQMGFTWTIPSGLVPGPYRIIVKTLDSSGNLARTSVSNVFSVVSSNVTPAASTKNFVVGVDRIKVTANGVQTRVTPGGASLTAHDTGDQGLVVGGPQYAVISGVGYWWWNVNYDSGSDGWVAENWLEKINTVPAGQPVVSVSGPASLQISQSGTWTVAATDPNGDVLTYEATWGDGASTSASSASTLTHTFSTAGTFSVTFKVKDPGGLFAQLVKTVTVTMGAAKFSVGDPVKVVFHNASEAGNSNCIANPANGSGGWAINAGQTGNVLDGPYNWIGSNLWKVGFINGPCWFWEQSLEKSLPASGKFSIGERIKLIGASVNIGNVPSMQNSSDISGSMSADSDPLWSGIKLSGFKTGKGTIIDGPYGTGASTKWKVDYDYGPDGWTPEANLQSMGVPTGKWTFTSDNILGRELKAGDGTLVIDPYYTSVNYQVSEIAKMAQSSLPPAAVAAQSNISGGWHCAGTYTGSTNPNNFWGDSICRFEKGNQPPFINSFTGSASVTTNINGNWQFTASDPEGALASYKIDWGDGSGVMGPVPLSGGTASKDVVHAYTQAGTFTITLTVTDGAGLKATKTLPVTAVLPCSTRFQAGDRVKVINTDSEHPLNVRSSPERPSNPDANKLGGHYNDDQGVISGGPTAGSGYCWWNISFDQAPSGWSAEGGGSPIQYWLDKVVGGGTGSGNSSNQSSSGGTTPGGSQPQGTSPNIGTSNDISISSPASGEVWQVGELRTIIWSAPSTITNIDIRISSGGYIVRNYPNTGRYEWIIPQTISGVSTQSSQQVIYIASAGTDNYKQSGVFSISAKQLKSGDLVMNTDTVSVRADVGNAQSTQGTQFYGAVGTITSGPTAGSDGNYWYVDYQSGADGWVNERFLAKVPPTNPTNQAPVFGDILGSTSVNVNVAGSWQVRATDADDMSLTYSISWGDDSSNTSITGSSGETKTVSHTYSSAGQKIINVTVSDGRGGTASKALTITVNTTSGPTNQPPILGIPTGAASIAINTLGSWQVIATDPDSANLTYTVNWGDGNSNTYTGMSGQSVTITHTYTQAGFKTIQLTVTDNAGNSVSATPIGVNVTAPVVVTPTGGGSIAPRDYQLGTRVKTQSSFSSTVNVRQMPSASGAEPAILGSQPVGAVGAITGTGIPVWFAGSNSVSPGWFWQVDFDNGTDGWVHESVLALADNTAVTHTISVTADSLMNPTSVYVGKSNTWNVATNVPTTFDTDTPRRACAGAIDYTVDWGDGTPIYSITTSCANKTSLFPTHTYLKGGAFDIKVNVTSNVTITTWIEPPDALGRMNSTVANWVGTAGKTLRVNVVYEPIRIDKFEIMSGVLGKPNQMRILISGGAAGPLTFTFAWGDGTPVSTQTGASGVALTATHTYATPGNYTVVVIVRDSAGATATKTLAPVGQPPTLSSVTTPTVGVMGVATTFQFSVADPEGSKISYSVDWGDGKIDTYNNGGNGYLAGTVTVSHTYSSVGSYNVMFTAYDSAGNLAFSTKPIQIKEYADALFKVGDRVKIVASDAGIVGSIGMISEGPTRISGAWIYKLNGSTGSVNQNSIVLQPVFKVGDSARVVGWGYGAVSSGVPGQTGSTYSSGTITKDSVGSVLEGPLVVGGSNWYRVKFGFISDYLIKTNPDGSVWINEFVLGLPN